MQCAGIRIATPVCALVRNDRIGYGAESPGIGSTIGAFCRVVEDADPYETAGKSGADSPKIGNEIGIFCTGRRGRRPLRSSRKVRCGFAGNWCIFWSILRGAMWASRPTRGGTDSPGRGGSFGVLCAVLLYIIILWLISSITTHFGECG